MTVDEWLGLVQTFMEERMKDAPDEACRSFAESVLHESATLPGDDDAAP